MGDIMEEMIINGTAFKKIKVDLPKTTLLIISSDKGFIMCGALNVEIYNSEKLRPRNVLCANVVGVKTFDELMAAKLNDVSDAFSELGAYSGMRVKDALYLLA